MEDNKAPPNNNIYASNAFIGISLWLVPKGESLEKLKNIIECQSKELNTETFTPHVTLVAGLTQYTKESIALQVQNIAKEIEPFSVKIQKVSSKELYFQCIFGLTEKTPEIIAANDVARKLLNLPKDTAYMPHVSLVYSNDLDSTVKVTCCHNLQPLVSDTVLEFDSISVWSTAGKVSDWFHITDIPLRT